MSKPDQPDTKPVVIITIGMAGSGKTTFVQRINSHLRSVSSPSKIVRASSPKNLELVSSAETKEEVEKQPVEPTGNAPPAADQAQPPRPPYILNLDPAVSYMPFEANIDIRDTINYAEVMKQYVTLVLPAPLPDNLPV